MNASNIPTHIDVKRPALGIRYPWLELIMQGIKTLEVRSRRTQIRGTVYLYASQSDVVTRHSEALVNEHGLELQKLPRGVIVGEIQVTNCRPAVQEDAAAATVSPAELENQYAWELAQPVRYQEPLAITCKPYGSWFYPYQRKLK